MTGDDPLARKLATLTAKDAFDGRALRLGLAGQPEAMSHILQAIDDTMLLRDAVFAVGKSQVILRVSGKRLQAVVAASDDLAAPSTLLGQALSISQPDLLAETAALLQRLVTQTGTLTLDRRSTEDAAGSGSGVGVQALSTAWDAALTVTPDDPIEVFLAGWLAEAVAYIEVEDNAVVEADGDDATIDVLLRADETTWQAFQKAHTTLQGAQKPPQLWILEGLTGTKGMLVAARIEKRRYLALIPPASIGQVTAAWAACLK